MARGVPSDITKLAAFCGGFSDIGAWECVGYSLQALASCRNCSMCLDEK